MSTLTIILIAAGILILIFFLIIIIVRRVRKRKINDYDPSTRFHSNLMDETHRSSGGSSSPIQNKPPNW